MTPKRTHTEIVINMKIQFIKYTCVKQIEENCDLLLTAILLDTPLNVSFARILERCWPNYDIYILIDTCIVFIRGSKSSDMLQSDHTFLSKFFIHLLYCIP